MIGKYIYEHWVNGDYVHNSLRYINRETKKYYLSDVQRSAKNWKDDPVKYVFFNDWAIKFVKDETTELGFRRSVGHLANTEGVMEYTVLNSPAECKCKYTFEEVFGNDVRKIQDERDSPLRSLKFMKEKHQDIKMNLSDDEFFKVHLYKKNEKVDDEDDFIYYLKNTFKVSKVFSTISVMGQIDENHKQTILSKSGTLFQITTFNIDKKEITLRENDNNCTIMFWLFDDKLVYQHESGKKTW